MCMWILLWQCQEIYFKWVIFTRGNRVIASHPHPGSSFYCIRIPVSTVPALLQKQRETGIQFRFCWLLFRTFANIRLTRQPGPNVSFSSLSHPTKVHFSYQWVSTWFPILSHRHGHVRMENMLRVPATCSHQALTTQAGMRARTTLLIFPNNTNWDAQVAAWGPLDLKKGTGRGCTTACPSCSCCGQALRWLLQENQHINSGSGSGYLEFHVNH